jgi:hypothetical protein
MVNPFHLHNWGKLSGHLRIPVLTKPPRVALILANAIIISILSGYIIILTLACRMLTAY